jgi:hypothetical protein
VFIAASAAGESQGTRRIVHAVRMRFNMADRSRVARRQVSDQLPAMLQNREHLSPAAQDAILAAWIADGPVQRADRDDARRWSAIRTNVAAATGPAAWADALRQVREYSHFETVRIVREQNLETALASRMRIHHATIEPATAGDYDATLCAPISERADRERFAGSFAAILADLVAADGNAAIRTIPAVLADLTADLARADAIRYREAAATCRAAETGARAALDAAKESGAKSAIKSADSAWRKTHAAAADADRLAGLAVQVFVTVRDHGAIELADLVAMSVFAPTVTAGAKLTGSARRAAADASRWDRGAVLTLLGLSPAANGRPARALDAVVKLAAERALDTAVSDAVTLPNMREGNGRRFAANATARVIVKRDAEGTAAAKLAAYKAPEDDTRRLAAEAAKIERFWATA